MRLADLLRCGGFRTARGHVAVTIGGGRHGILLLEEFDEVRRIGESAFVADFGDGFRGRNQQQARVH